MIHMIIIIIIIRSITLSITDMSISVRLEGLLINSCIEKTNGNHNKITMKATGK